LAATDDSGGLVVYPNVAVGLGGNINSQQYSISVPGGYISDSVVAKKTAIVFTGCFVYKTAGKVRHSAWCYFWNGDTTAFQHFNICMGAGNDAD
jgi:hypothetical protein